MMAVQQQSGSGGELCTICGESLPQGGAYYVARKRCCRVCHRQAQWPAVDESEDAWGGQVAVALCVGSVVFFGLLVLGWVLVG